MPTDLKTLAMVTNLSNEDQLVYDIHDILKAYQNVAIKRLMDNMVMAVLERWWLGRSGFVMIFGSDFVGRLSDGELASNRGR